MLGPINIRFTEKTGILKQYRCESLQSCKLRPGLLLFIIHILLPSDNLILESGADVATQMVVSLRKRMQKNEVGFVRQ